MRGMTSAILGIVLIGTLVRVKQIQAVEPPDAENQKLAGLHLELHGISSGANKSILDFDVSMEPHPNRWFYESVRPKITRLTSVDGQPLCEPARIDFNFEHRFEYSKDWLAPGRSIFPHFSVNINRYGVEAVGIVEATAEITFASDLEYLDLGELTNADRTIEIEAGEKVLIRFDKRTRTCSCRIQVRDEREDRSKRFFVGIETFDANGEKSGSFTERMGTFNTYSSKERVPKTGRLVLASKIERVPINLHAEKIELDNVLLEKLKTMGTDELREIISKRLLSEERLFELARKAEEEDREDLVEILIDAGARVVGDEQGRDQESAERHFRLFQRYVKQAKDKHDQAKLNRSLADSYRGRGMARYRNEALAAGARIIQRSDILDSLMIELWITGRETAELVEPYARAVLENGTDFEIASLGGFNELLAAAYMGDSGRLSEEIKKNGAQYKDDWGRSALIWACSSPHSSQAMIKALLDAGVQSGEGSQDDPSALISAIKHSRFDLAKVLLDGGASKSLNEKSTQEVIERAVLSKNHDLVHALIAAGIKVDKMCATRLFVGVGGLGEVTILSDALAACLESGLDEASMRSAIGTGLVSAVQGRKLEAIQWFISSGAVISGDGENSALYWAGMNKNKVVLDLIIELAAKQSFLGRPKQGRRITAGEEAMIFACAMGAKETVHKLLGYGVVPTGEWTMQGSVLTASVSSGSIELVKLVLDQGLDVNAMGPSGENAVLSAANANWSVELLELLASRGGNFKAYAPRSGCPTLVAGAVRLKDPRLLDAVLKLGAPVAVQQGLDLYDALESAIRNSDFDAVKMLLVAGVKPGVCISKYGRNGQEITHMELAKKLVSENGGASRSKILNLIEEASK